MAAHLIISMMINIRDRLYMNQNCVSASSIILYYFMNVYFLYECQLLAPKFNRPLGVYRPPFDPQTFIDPLDSPIDPRGSISTTLGTPALDEGSPRIYFPEVGKN